MPMAIIVESIGRLYTCNDADVVLDNAWIIIEGRKISALGSGPSPEGDYSERIDLKGAVAFPGFVNAHHHFFQSLTRALPGVQRGHLWEWLGMLYPVWGGMTPDDLAAAAASTSAELLLTGATTSVDHFYLMPGADPAFVDTAVTTAKTAGLRLHLVRGSLTGLEGDLEAKLSKKLGPKAGGLVDDPDRVLADMRRAVKTHHDTSFGSMTTIALGPTTPTYDDLDFLRSVSRLATESEVGLHTHLHPQPADRARTASKFGRSPIDVLDEVGFLTHRTWIAHGTRLDAYDLQRMMERGVGLSHSPRMIMRLGSRITPLHKAVSAGLKIGIGVDGAASNDGGSMLGEMRIALLLHRLADGGDEVDFNLWLDPYDVLLMSTRRSAELIGRSDIGSISVGKCADLTAFDLSGVDYAGARADPLTGLLLCGDGSRAALTMVGGKTLVRDGRLLGQDERKLRQRTDAASERLVRRAQQLTGADYMSFPPRIKRDSA